MGTHTHRSAKHVRYACVRDRIDYVACRMDCDEQQTCSRCDNACFRLQGHGR